MGGLNTSFYAQGSYVSLFNPLRIYDQQFYYNINDINGTVFNVPYNIYEYSIVSNFQDQGSISANYVISPTWEYIGFKSFGFIKPTQIGEWNFYITADDVAEIWIGSDLSGNPTSISPYTTSNAVTLVKGQTRYASQFTINFNSLSYYPILIYYGQSYGGLFFELDIYSPGNNPSNYYGNIVPTSRTPHNTIFNYINYNLPPPPATVLITGGAYNGFSSSGLIQNTYYNSSNASSGTLYRFTSGTCTFKLTSGYLDCYLLSIGPGGSGGTSAGSGGSGCLLSFTLVPNITYTITFSNGTITNGTTTAGFCKVLSNDSPTTINITTPGGTTTGTAVATQTGTIAGNILYKYAGGGSGGATGVGGNGFTISSTINTINSTGLSDFITLLTSANGQNGFSGGGRGSSTLGGSGGQYNVGGSTYSSTTSGTAGVGYGTGGGALASGGSGGAGGAGVVFLYLSPFI